MTDDSLAHLSVQRYISQKLLCLVCDVIVVSNLANKKISKKTSR